MTWKSNGCLRFFFCWECSSLSHTRKAIVGHLCILVVMTLSFLVLLLPCMNSTLSNFPCCRSPEGILLEACKISSGVVVSLRFSFVFFLFFLVSFILELTAAKIVSTLPIVYGFWSVKCALIALGCFGTLYIKPRAFDRIWTVPLWLGSSMFVVIETYTVIRFSYLIKITLQKAVENGFKAASKVQAVLFIVGIILSILGVAMLLYYYPLCGINLVFMIVNAAASLGAYIWSVTKWVKKRNPYSGFIQGIILICFVSFYTGSAFVNNRDIECNPYFRNYHSYVTVYHGIEIVIAFVIYLLNQSFSFNIYTDELECYKQEGGRKDIVALGHALGDLLGECKEKVYNSLLCSFTRCLMLCFILMSFLCWAPTSASTDLDKTNFNAMWFKILGCWLSIFFFVITLYLPSVYGVTRKNLT